MKKCRLVRKFPSFTQKDISLESILTEIRGNDILGLGIRMILMSRGAVTSSSPLKKVAPHR